MVDSLGAGINRGADAFFRFDESRTRRDQFNETMTQRITEQRTAIDQFDREFGLAEKKFGLGERIQEFEEEKFEEGEPQRAATLTETKATTRGQVLLNERNQSKALEANATRLLGRWESLVLRSGGDELAAAKTIEGKRLLDLMLAKNPVTVQQISERDGASDNPDLALNFLDDENFGLEFTNKDGDRTLQTKDGSVLNGGRGENGEQPTLIGYTIAQAVGQTAALSDDSKLKEAGEARMARFRLALDQGDPLDAALRTRGDIVRVTQNFDDAAIAEHGGNKVAALRAAFVKNESDTVKAGQFSTGNPEADAKLEQQKASQLEILRRAGDLEDPDAFVAAAQGRPSSPDAIAQNKKLIDDFIQSTSDAGRKTRAATDEFVKDKRDERQGEQITLAVAGAMARIGREEFADIIGTDEDKAGAAAVLEVMNALRDPAQFQQLVDATFGPGRRIERRQLSEAQIVDMTEKLIEDRSFREENLLGLPDFLLPESLEGKGGTGTLGEVRPLSQGRARVKGTNQRGVFDRLIDSVFNSES